jgi:hypothetical protein
MKTVKKKPELLTFVYTEKDILVKISHVSYRTFVRRRKQGKPTIILPAELVIMNPHPPLPNISWHFAPKIWPITLLRHVISWVLLLKTSGCWHTN